MNMSTMSPDPQNFFATSEYMEHFLRFTLTSFLDGTLGADLPFSKEYCSRLLQEDDDCSYPHQPMLPIQGFVILLFVSFHLFLFLCNLFVRRFCFNNCWCPGIPTLQDLGTSLRAVRIFWGFSEAQF